MEIDILYNILQNEQICLNYNNCLKLQSDVVNIIEWCKVNGMKLRSPKCFDISYTRSNFPLHFEYRINDNLLPRTEVIKELGVYVDSKLIFYNDIDSTILKANRPWSFIWWNLKYFKDWQSVRILYLSLVRSNLLYASIIWKP